MNALLEHLASHRRRREQGGTTWNGWQVPTDDRSILKYAGEAIAVSLGMRADGDLWKLPHGFEALSNAEFMEMATAARAHVQACFAAEAVVRASIGAGETVDRSDLLAAFDEAMNG